MGGGCLGIILKNNPITGTRKKFAECGLSGNNSNLVIRWRVWGCIFSLIIEIVLRGGAILMVEGRFGGWAKINPVTVSPAPMWAHRRIVGGV